jgi:putative transposase
MRRVAGRQLAVNWPSAGRLKHLVRNRTRAKAIGDASWGERVRRLPYKAAWRGRTLVTIDRRYPSGKTCHARGHVPHELALHELALDGREWSCPACGVLHDRDLNAAKTILAVGRTV